MGTFFNKYTELQNYVSKTITIISVNIDLG